MLKGFIAIDADLKTIRGLAYYEQGETPGLGGEVDNPDWKAKWNGKLLFDESGHPDIHLIKNADPSNKHAVDALSGATITSRGVEHMLQYWMGDQAFGPYLTKLRQKSSSTQTAETATPVAPQTNQPAAQ